MLVGTSAGVGVDDGPRGLADGQLQLPRRPHDGDRRFLVHLEAELGGSEEHRLRLGLQDLVVLREAGKDLAEALNGARAALPHRLAEGVADQLLVARHQGGLRLQAEGAEPPYAEGNLPVGHRGPVLGLCKRLDEVLDEGGVCARDVLEPSKAPQRNADGPRTHLGHPLLHDCEQIVEGFVAKEVITQLMGEVRLRAQNRDPVKSGGQVNLRKALAVALCPDDC
uniref:Uncharacterized protein n=1 Tax=Tetraselmis sp. GSL018 TaxID=582737 RepID=A0A061RDW4_9CHLO